MVQEGFASRLSGGRLGIIRRVALRFSMGSLLPMTSIFGYQTTQIEVLVGCRQPRPRAPGLNAKCWQGGLSRSNANSLQQRTPRCDGKSLICLP
jgi:hypothetical protein